MSPFAYDWDCRLVLAYDHVGNVIKVRTKSVCISKTEQEQGRRVQDVVRDFANRVSDPYGSQ